MKYLFKIVFVLLPIYMFGQQRDWHVIAKESVFDQSAEVEIKEILADNNGDIVVMGLYYGRPTFAGKLLPNYKGSITSRSFFLSKLDGNSGKMIWLHTGMDSDFNSAKLVFHSINLDTDGFIHILAEVQDNLTFNDTVISNSTTNSTSAIIKYRNDGALISIKKIFENQWPLYNGIAQHCFALDKDGNYFIFLNAVGELWRDNFQYAYPPNASFGDLCLAKFDNNLNLQWFKGSIFNTTNYINTAKLAYNYHDVLFIGWHDAKRQYLLSFDTSGNMRNDFDSYQYKFNDIMCDKSGNLYAGGRWQTNELSPEIIALLKFDSKLNSTIQYRSQYGSGVITDIYLDTSSNQVIFGGVCDSALHFQVPFELPKKNLGNNGRFLAVADLALKPFLFKNGFIEGHLFSKSHVTQSSCGNPFFCTSFREKNITFDNLEIDGRGMNANTNPRGVSSFIVKYASDTFGFINYNASTLHCNSIRLLSKFSLDYANIYWLYNDKIIDSNKKELKYSFSKSGKYAITLLGIKESNCKYNFTDTITFFKQPEAKFTHKDTVGCQWVGYKFINQSTADTIHSKNGESYFWDFGDGTTDTAKNPLHIFTKSGNFKVSLVYSNGFCADTFIQEQTVEILAAPKPGFTINDTNGCAPFTVNVKDNSQGAVVKYTYSFGKEHESEEASPDYTFTKPGIYYIVQKLLGSTGCITSDSVRVKIRAGILPDEKPQMFRATFISNNQVEISWRKHPFAKYYTLYKQVGNTLQTIQKHFSDTVYMDHAVSLTEPFHYFIQATDSCGNVSAQSAIAQPVILHGENMENTVFMLQYTAYEKWQNGVKEYFLQYQVEEDSFINIGNSPALSQADSFRRQSPNSTQCYRILALEMDGNKQFSFSNTVCLQHIPQVYIPNAFSPNNDAVNDIFRISAIGVTESNISIYNRWGEKIYQNIRGEEINWNGKFKSSPSPEDIYFYTLQLRTIHGKTIYQTGNIHLKR